MALLWNGSGIWSNLEEDTQKTKCFSARLFLNWTYSLLQFIAQMHPRLYWCSRGCCNTGARDGEEEHTILAVPLEGCAGKTAATRGALITGGKRLRSLGNDELLFSALIAGSSSVPPERGSKHLSLKPKLQPNLALLLPCGAWRADSRGCMRTDISKRGHLFQMFGNTGLGIPMGFVSLGAYHKSNPVWWWTVSEAEDLRRRLLVLGRTVMLLCHLLLTLITLCWRT